MSIAAEIAFRIVGLFYLASGVLVVRSLAAAAMTDAVHAAIVGRPPHPAERRRAIWLAAGSVLIAVGGLALMLLLDVSAVLFLLGALQQFAYLFVVAPRFFDPHDEPDPVGRARTRNAAVAHLVATLAVVAAGATGGLRPWREESNWLLGAAVVAAALGVGWTLRAMRPRLGLGETE